VESSIHPDKKNASDPLFLLYLPLCRRRVCRFHLPPSSLHRRRTPSFLQSGRPSERGFFGGHESASASHEPSGGEGGELTVIAAGTFGLTGGFLLLSGASSFLSVFLTLILAKGTAAGQHGLSSSVLSRVFETSGRRAAMEPTISRGMWGKWPSPSSWPCSSTGWTGGRESSSFPRRNRSWRGSLVSGQERKGENPLPKTEAKEKDKNKGGVSATQGLFRLLTIGILDIATRSSLLTFLPFLLLQKEIPAAQIGFALTLLFAGGARESSPAEFWPNGSGSFPWWWLRKL